MRRADSRTILGFTALALGLLASGTAGAQASRPGDDAEAINERFRAQVADLEREHLAALAALAARQKGDEAAGTSLQVLNLAVARELYKEAEATASRVIDEDLGGGPLQSLARFVKVVAVADRGDPDGSLRLLETYLKERPEGADAAEAPDTGTVLAIGEAYLQRLLRAGRYDTAQKLCELAARAARRPEVRDHFTRRLERVRMVGRPAPALAGKGVDGESVRLEDYRGKVVLVEFWASWCPPCGPEMDRLVPLVDRHKAEGFAVLGVNEDALREGAQGVESAVRRFLIAHRIPWPNALDAPGDASIARAFGVAEIPASFLIGRDGTILGVELSGPDLERAVVEALGQKPATPPAEGGRR